jgi:hypothetical protein
MYKLGGEDVVGDASTKGSSRRPGSKGKARGVIKAAVFSCGRARRVWEGELRENEVGMMMRW